MKQQNSLNQPKIKKIQCQPSKPALLSGLVTGLVIMTVTPIKPQRDNSVYLLSSPSVFSLMSELNPRSIGRRTDHSSKTKILPTVKAVDSVGMTVDMDRSLEFYSRTVLQKGIRCRGLGANYTLARGFGLRMRVVRCSW